LASGADEKFTIKIVPEQDMLEVTLSGFFTEVDMAEFLPKLVDARNRLSPDRSKRKMLYNVSEFRLQSQEVLGQFAALISDPGSKSGRVAIYVGTAAIRMQAERIAGDNTAVFGDAGEAREWLLRSD
jgi:hypothetical protein